MTLAPGTRFGVYEIVGPIGAGGMGEVYRARDHKLGRDVAIKILPAAFASDPDRLMRFEREARTLASLNHPNIAQIYGHEQFGDLSGLVLELVDGPTLAERIHQHPIEIGEARQIVSQICAALAAAHDLGIVHRDLKPANIKLRHDGAVKVLDFGLAKLAATDAQVSAAATITSPATMRGEILGTAAYMSPEQARGQVVDKRTDVWSLGCVIFEMLTGASPFAATTTTDAIAAVVTKEPEWHRLPASTPARWRALLKQCLEKDVNRRLRDAGDVSLLLESGEAELAAPPRHRWIALLAGAVALLAIGFGAARFRTAPAEDPAAPLRLQLPAGRALTNSRIALSPQGDKLAYVANTETGRQLFVHDLRNNSTQAIAVGTDPVEPFFSPAGDHIGVYATGSLRLLRLGTGTEKILCPVSGNFFGGTFTADGRTIFYASNGSIYQVSVEGGSPVRVARDEARPLRYPAVLPEGKSLLYVAYDLERGSPPEIVRHDLDTGARRTLTVARDFRYLPTGHLLVMRDDALFLLPFSAQGVVDDNSQPVVQEVSNTLRDGGVFDAARSQLVYLSRSEGDPRRLVVVTREGGITPVNVPARNYQQPRLSPDGRHLVVEELSPPHSVWTLNLATTVLSKLTMPGPSHNPIWSHDGSRIAYQAARESGEPGSIYWKPADGSGLEERLFAASTSGLAALSWSPDGSSLMLEEISELNRNLLLMDRRKQTAEPWLASEAHESGAVISPDGKFVAYHSNATGRYEVYVRPLSRQEHGSWQVTTEGGAQPVWSRNGRELYYRRGNGVVAVAVNTARAFSAGRATPLFEGNFLQREIGSADYDVFPDGRFVMLQSVQSPSNEQLTLIVNWRQLLTSPARQ